MNRLQTELQRLYGPSGDGVRALVLEVVGPGGWDALSAVWRGVQADLELPAPAIAVSGSDGLQLWFSLATPATQDQALAFLEGLRRRYLGGTPAARVRVQTLAAAAAHVPAFPPTQHAPERWSAFIAADLAPLFAGEPWLDHPPGVDAQADLLARIASTPSAAFRAAAAQLQPATDTAAPPAPGARPAGGSDGSARQFLQSVMNDPQAPLALRIEAAKALLTLEARPG